jgi:hypothetical protein
VIRLTLEPLHKAPARAHVTSRRTGAPVGSLSSRRRSAPRRARPHCAEKQTKAAPARRRAIDPDAVPSMGGAKNHLHCRGSRVAIRPCIQAIDMHDRAEYHLDRGQHVNLCLDPISYVSSPISEGQV